MGLVGVRKPVFVTDNCHTRCLGMECFQLFWVRQQSTPSDSREQGVDEEDDADEDEAAEEEDDADEGVEVQSFSALVRGPKLWRVLLF